MGLSKPLKNVTDVFKRRQLYNISICVYIQGVYIQINSLDLDTSDSILCIFNELLVLHDHLVGDDVHVLHCRKKMLYDYK